MKKKHKKRGIVIGGVPIYGFGKDEDKITYILLQDIQEKFRAEFARWMYGQTGAVIHGDHVIYSWDWERWYEMKLNDTPTYFD